MGKLDSKKKIISEKTYSEAENFIFNLSMVGGIDDREKFQLKKYNKEIHGIQEESPRFPMIVKTKN